MMISYYRVIIINILKEFGFLLEGFFFLEDYIILRDFGFPLEAFCFPF